MFINPSKFEKALRRAYEYQGVTAYRDDEMLAIDAGEWCCEMRMSRLTKEVHAALIKTVGWLPMIGEAYKYIKAQPEQMTMPTTVTRACSWRQTTGELILVHETPILLEIPGDNDWRVMQTETGKIFTLKESILRMVDPRKVEDGEPFPEPYLHMGQVVWSNDAVTLAVCAWKGEEGLTEQVPRGLEMLDRDLRSAHWAGKWVTL